MVDDLYQWGGDGVNPNPNRPGQPGQPGFQPGQPGQPGGRDLFQYGGDNIPRPGQYPPAQTGYGPWQQQWMNEQQNMRARQFWGGRAQGGGDIYVTAMPGSEVVINNGGGDYNMRGGQNYDYRYPGGQNYNYQQYFPRQNYQPGYQAYQYRDCGCPQGTMPVYAPDYYRYAQPGQQAFVPQARAGSVYGGPGGFYAGNQTMNGSWNQGYGQNGMGDASQIFGMALQGFDAFAAYSIARQDARRPNMFFGEPSLAYGWNQRQPMRHHRPFQC